MKRVGAHVSAAGGVQEAPRNAAAIGARAFALFTKNQRQWQAAPLTPAQVSQFRQACVEFGYAPAHILPHDTYLINLGNPDPAGLEKSRQAFIAEMGRCAELGLTLFNFHPGSHKGLISEEACLERVAESMALALDACPGVMAVVENTAGQGGAVGYRFEHLKRLAQLTHRPGRVGICLDTAHLFASGYDLRGRDAYERTLAEFDRVVGMPLLKAMHLNDSKAKFASRVDRHHSLGQGELGLEPFRLIMNDPRLEEMPLILETIDENRWEEEIRLLYSFCD